MNSKIIQECEQSLYRELYHMNRKGQSIVVNVTTGRICVQKKLEIYDRSVYRYLLEHRHPNVPEVYSVWEDGSVLTVVEEYVQGETLEELLQRNALSADMRKNIVLQLCSALTFLHGARPPIIHRDIKASNIMVTRHGTAVLIDYDAAKIYHPEKSSDTVLLGTEGSAAPEQYGFRQSDARTDIYALGVLIKEMFPGDRHMQEVAEYATRMEPERRYQTAEELREAVEHPSRVRPGKPRINIPGFRTLTPWKMILSSVCYVAAVDICLTSPFDADSAAELWVYRIGVLCMFFSMLDLFTDWTHLFRYLPFNRGSSIKKRIPGYIVSVLGIIVFWMIIMLFIIDMMHLLT